MDKQARHEFLVKLDEDTLFGGASFSEWCILIARDCDLAFVAGADLATIITAAAAIETYLRAEYGGKKRCTFAELIQEARITPDLAVEIDKLRKYRNGWVHVASPHDDSTFSSDAPEVAEELMSWAVFAQSVLRKTLFMNQWI